MLLCLAFGGVWQDRPIALSSMAVRHQPRCGPSALIALFDDPSMRLRPLPTCRIDPAVAAPQSMAMAALHLTPAARLTRILTFQRRICTPCIKRSTYWR